jgi:isoleucyl-tRNA synthetase
LILAKNLVGKQFGKGFYESKDLTDFENFKEGDKKIHTKYLLNVKGGFSWNQIRTVNAISTPYQNAENAFRISGDFVTIEMEQESFTHRLLVQMMQSSERGST